MPVRDPPPLGADLHRVVMAVAIWFVAVAIDAAIFFLAHFRSVHRATETGYPVVLFRLQPSSFAMNSFPGARRTQSGSFVNSPVKRPC